MFFLNLTSAPGVISTISIGLVASYHILFNEMPVAKNRIEIAQNNPARATVVNVGVLLFHLKLTEPIEKPKDDKRPSNKPNNVPTLLLLKAIKVIPTAAMIIDTKVVNETFSLRKIYPSIAVMNGIAANVIRVTAAEVWVIDQIKPIKAVAKPMPPITTDKSIF